jgi:predicted nucleic acid-binding protein
MKSDWKSEPLIVLDACALIAFLNDEPGADLVDEILRQAPAVHISAINLLEVAYDAIRTTGEDKAANEIIDAVGQLPIDIRWHIDRRVIAIAARYKSKYRISLADSIALGHAEHQNAPLATSDHHEFEPLEAAGIARILWIR